MYMCVVEELERAHARQESEMNLQEPDHLPFSLLLCVLKSGLTRLQWGQQVKRDKHHSWICRILRRNAEKGVACCQGAE